ncbi:MAG: HAMP domain-containing protein [Nitrospinota bacterium]
MQAKAQAGFKRKPTVVASFSLIKAGSGSFQTGFMVRFFLLILAGGLLFATIMYLGTTETQTTAFENLRLVIKSTADFILPTLAMGTLIQVILISAAAVLTILYSSHKIAGPLFKLERCVERIGGGDLTTDIYLRRGDEVQGLAKSLREMVEAFRARMGELQEAAIQLERSAAALGRLGGEGGAPSAELRAALGELEEARRELARSLAFFKTPT